MLTFLSMLKFAINDSQRDAVVRGEWAQRGIMIAWSCWWLMILHIIWQQVYSLGRRLSFILSYIGACRECLSSKKGHFCIMWDEQPSLQRALHWSICLLCYRILNRAYLSRYLMPAEIPAEYLQVSDSKLILPLCHPRQPFVILSLLFVQDDMLADLLTRLRELQEEFKQVHKTVDQLRNNNLRYVLV